jgi:hypothetical protein
LQQGGSLRKQLRLCHCGWGGIALPHATNHMHPTTSGSQGYTEDVRIAFREQERLQTQLFQRLGQLSGYTWQEIEEHFTHDRFMNALDAKAFGLVDHILCDIRNIITRTKSGEMQLANSLLDVLPPSYPLIRERVNLVPDRFVESNKGTCG